MNEQKTVTLKEARFAIGCGEKFLRAEIKRGAIAVRRVNARVILVYLDSLNGYIESRRTTTAEKNKIWPLVRASPDRPTKESLK